MELILENYKFLVPKNVEIVTKVPRETRFSLDTDYLDNEIRRFNQETQMYD